VEDLKIDVQKSLLTQGVEDRSIRYDVFLHLRYEGTETQQMIPQPVNNDYRTAFEEEHLRELAFLFPATRKVIVDDIRVWGAGASTAVSKDNECLTTESQAISFKVINPNNAAHKVGRSLHPLS
jgi:5-oxoprolinase (ATP-hydrolysing)